MDLRVLYQFQPHWKVSIKYWDRGWTLNLILWAFPLLLLNDCLRRWFSHLLLPLLLLPQSTRDSNRIPPQSMPAQQRHLPANLNLTSNDDVQIFWNISHIFVKIQHRFLPIGNFHCAPLLHFCLQTFPAAIWVFAINYPKYWNYGKYRGAAAYLLAPRHDISDCTSYLFVQPPATFATFGGRKTRTKIGHKSDTLAIQWRTRDQVIKSSATHLNWERRLQKVRICRISFCCKIRCCLCRGIRR